MSDSRAQILGCLLGGGFLLAAVSVLAGSDFDQGATAYRNGDYATALTVFRPLADGGDAQAQTILALMYSYGEGVPTDHQEAVRWYRRAAAQHSSVAQYNLGMFYLEGKGVAHDNDKAVDYLTRAAESGHQRARSQLARLQSGSRGGRNAVTARSLSGLYAVATDDSRPPADGVVTADKSMSKTDATVRKAHNRTRARRPGTVAASGTAATVDASAQMPATDENAGAQPGQAEYVVQLLASRNEEYVLRDWSNYRQRYPEVFAALQASIERSESGDDGAAWFRLRVGPFADMSAARALCEQLQVKAIGSGCLPMRDTDRASGKAPSRLLTSIR